MDEKIEEVIEKYPITVKNKKRIRGAILFEAEEGLFVLTKHKDSKHQIVFREEVKAHLQKQGFLVDLGVKNEEGNWLTKDAVGNLHLLKHWYIGRECNLKENSEVCQAMENLARLHQGMVHVGENMELLAAQIENEEVNIVPEENLQEMLGRRIREMRRVYNYIRTKKRKNDVELSLLSQFHSFYDQAMEAKELADEIPCEIIQEKCIAEGKVRHGSYTYHNILFAKDQIATVQFERCQKGMQVYDVYDFLRKLMEKNNWERHQGIRAIEAYRHHREMEQWEGKVLYTLLLFPEKFWKQMSFYYNGKKSWMSTKNLEKLEKIQGQEGLRRNFLEEGKRVLF